MRSIAVAFLALLADPDFTGCGTAPNVPREPAELPAAGGMPCASDLDCAMGCTVRRCVGRRCLDTGEPLDADRDGILSEPCGGDCDDGDSSVFPGASERSARGRPSLAAGRTARAGALARAAQARTRTVGAASAGRSAALRREIAAGSAAAEEERRRERSRARGSVGERRPDAPHDRIARRRAAEVLGDRTGAREARAPSVAPASVHQRADGAVVAGHTLPRIVRAARHREGVGRALVAIVAVGVVRAKQHSPSMHDGAGGAQAMGHQPQ
jgi:hypothetical protein